MKLAHYLKNKINILNIYIFSEYTFNAIVKIVIIVAISILAYTIFIRI